MPMRSLLLLLLIAACGGGDRAPAASDSQADTGAASADADRPAPNLHPAPLAAGNASSAPLTPEDISRWEKGLAGEMEAVQAAAAKLKQAKTGNDTLSAMMGVQEMTTQEAGAKAAGVDVERYNTIRSNLSAAVMQMTPPETEGMDTTKLPENLRAEFRITRENQLEQLRAMVPEEVQRALRPRALELRKKDLALVAARMKGIGM